MQRFYNKNKNSNQIVALTHVFNIVVALSAVILLSGCSTTKPNISIIDYNYGLSKKHQYDNFLAAKSILIQLASKNEILAIELGKLPELQDSVNSSELRGLKNTIDLYEKTPDAFDKAFKLMYQIGKPETRRYCSPLQAMYWLSESKDASQIEHLLCPFILEKLLSESWGGLTLNEMRTVIDGIKDDSSRMWYAKKLDQPQFQSGDGKLKLRRWLFNYYKNKGPFGPLT